MGMQEKIIGSFVTAGAASGARRATFASSVSVRARNLVVPTRPHKMAMRARATQNQGNTAAAVASSPHHHTQQACARPTLSSRASDFPARSGLGQITFDKLVQCLCRTFVSTLTQGRECQKK